MNKDQNNSVLSLSKLNCAVEDFSHEIRELLEAKNQGELYKKFGQKFLTYIPIDYRSKDEITLFSDFTDEAFEFFKQRKTTERKVQISNVSFQDNPAITILIIIENRPFIIDSLNCLISRLGLQSIFTFHPVVFSKRDSNGTLIDIVDKGDEDSRESLIFIKALGKFDDKTIKILKEEINRIIDLVDYTYHSWQILLNKLIGITTDIVHNKDVYEEASLPAEETLDFLNWLQKNNFTFLGMAEFDTASLKITHEDGVKDIWQNNIDEIKTIIKFSKSEYYDNKLAMLGKINKISPVHRNALVDYILVKHLDSKGKYVSGTIIFGLYGTAIYFQSIKSVPILRGKMNYVLDESGFPLNSYNAKKLKNIIESLPRETLIQIDETDLYCMCLHMLSSMRSRKLKLFIQQDWSGSFINVIIFMPRERLTPDVYNSIITYLSEKFESEIITDNITVVAQDFSHLFATIPIKDKNKLKGSSEEIEKDLIEITTNWSEALLQNLCKEYGEYEGGIRHKEIEAVFPTEYKHKFNADITIDDFHHLKKASRLNKTVFNLVQKPSHGVIPKPRRLTHSAIVDSSIKSENDIEHEFTLKIYSPSVYLTLSDTLPAIENLGFTAIDEQSFAIKETHDIKQSWIYEFILRSPEGIAGNRHEVTEKSKGIPRQAQDGLSTPNNDTFLALKRNIEVALEKINEGVFSSDALSKLLVIAGMNWNQVRLLKAIISYMHQTGINYGRAYVKTTLIKHHKFTKLLFDLFDAMFNPETHSVKLAKTINKELNTYLHTVSNSTEDKVLTNIKLIIQAIVRTNFYQVKKTSLPGHAMAVAISGENELLTPHEIPTPRNRASQNDATHEIKNYISFKFDSAKVPDLPLPRPYAEIFVYANEFEGIHLRGGKVARGGIRWSDRGEDYRYEVLGLVKAQMAKNAVIVPVGSKGGFFLNFEQGNLSRQDYMDKVRACYQNFLRGLLDVTDNLVDGKVVQPDNCVILDDENPYLVVAADKGTATFSDYANEVAAEYNFWLGDAFASGGSVGYDHKKMGITAKGAWLSARSHFSDMGRDIQAEEFTVAGIGDMSGDVFGNGMLLSKYTRLVAAFNHMHIFIDPNPDHNTSYKERHRLFHMPGSKWSDYDQKLISKGGGVFERSAKIIEISPEIQVALGLDVTTMKGTIDTSPTIPEQAGISQDTSNITHALGDSRLRGDDKEHENNKGTYSITPDNLIQAILKAKVDLLWNGGIGTYIKSSSENNIDIGDKSNDNVRVNGKDLRAKVLCEGGNVGVSQLGRIEYALRGGRLNTDFIDNSAGVDCSDHEVNIKIALNAAVTSGKITIDQRNKLLQDMTGQVEELVLLDNHDQNQAITIMQMTPAVNIEIFGQLIRDLEQGDLLNREVEFLPSPSELARRAVAKEKLTRPELSVLLSYSKMWVEKELINSNIAKDKYLEKYLCEYFPVSMRQNFHHEILHHPLKKEIIHTKIANKLVNQLGGTLLTAIKKETGGTLCDITRAYIVICELFNLDNLWQHVEELPPQITPEIKVDMFTDLAKVIRRGISWFIKNTKSPIDIIGTINEHRDQIDRISDLMSTILVGETKTKFKLKIKTYEDAGIQKDLAIDIASLELLISSFDIIHVAKITNSKNEDVANLYFESGDLLDIDWLRKSCEAQIDDSYWNRLSVQSLKDDFYDKQRRLVTEIIENNKNKVDLPTWINDNIKSASIFTNFVKEIKSQEVVNLNMLILANKKFELFLRKL